MARVKIQQATASQKGLSKREIYAMVCFYYPQYKLSEVQNLPARDIQLLLKTAKKLEASQNYNLTQIAAAPHSKKGAGVKKLLEHFQKVVKN
jgi:vancomycin permeability regulator SanA